ncbi:MAG: hypothetical protein HDS87_05075 [Bacteroidales bacterium]|nr:hypothetical protein [Bacteroidales bacterium]
MEFFIEPIPVWAMCYLINGDSTGLTDQEKALADDWWEGNNVQNISPASDNNGTSHPYFTHYPAFGLPTDVLECNVMTF